MANGARIANHQASAHVNQASCQRDITVSRKPQWTLKASATASAQLGIPVDSEFRHALEYVEQPDGKIVYAYRFQLLRNPVTNESVLHLNVMHDISYQYGFTERAGNFQTNNFGKAEEAMTLSLLITLEAGGMGEDGSDTMALIVLAKSSDTATTRSTMAQCRHLCFGSLLESCCQRGFSANLHDASQSAGNVVAMKIILGGMMMIDHLCTFLSARNAIISADASYNGANQMRDHQGVCQAWSRCQNTRTRRNDFSITSGC
ncbi:hypothetical protein BSLG_010844 [Batrachochytrium salamandrivorans]|nr:hypothetical protein BSLG_010844 [Batrachochytrium salamandrivorans]